MGPWSGEQRWWNGCGEAAVCQPLAIPGQFNTAQEAVTLYREPVKLNPDAHLPELARSVHNLSIHLAAVGRRAEALDTAQEAANHYSELDDHYPGIFDSSRRNNQNVIEYLANQKTAS